MDLRNDAFKCILLSEKIIYFQLALWINDGTDLQAVNGIGALIKECLLITEGKQFYFENHAVTLFFYSF